MRGFINILVLAVIFGMMFSCQKDSQPNYQFFPQMYQSPSYETYGEYEIFADEQSAMIPVEGTIARGFGVYDYEDTNEGYELAKAELKSPLDSTQIDMARAKELYDIYCGICHGAKGDGNGYLVAEENVNAKYPAQPALINNDEFTAASNGRMYHAIMFVQHA